jgi:hypothetical protein
MYKKLILVITVLLTFTCKAQLNIIQYPLQGMELKPSDIFKADIQSMDNVVNKIYLNGSIVNIVTGEQVITARSQIMDIAPGVKSITEAIAAPQYTITSSTVNQTGVLPYGNYRICLKAIKVNGVEELATACQEIEITPLSPPLLLSPENQSTVSEPLPLLVWLPPMPISKDKVVYDLKLVEILPNQTPYDALQRNFAIIEKQSIYGTTLQYPATAIALEEGKKYAWKVEAKTPDRKPIGETEVWWFTKAKETIEPKQPQIAKNFVKMKPALDSYYIIVQNELKFIYEEKYKDTKMKAVITDLKGKKIEEFEFDIAEVGENHFAINLNIKGLKDNQFYILEASAPNRAKQYLMFKNINK